MAGEWEYLDHGEAGKSWINPGQARLNVVFVHGFKGDHLATWTDTGPSAWYRMGRGGKSTLLMDLLRADPDLPCHYFSVAHEAGIVSPTTIETAGGVIQTFLRNCVMGNGLPIALVAHSFGGLASRFAILRMLDEMRDDMPVIGILMMGTPNNGTEIARAAKTLGSAAGRDMRPFDETLEKLNREWTAHVVNGGDPDRDAGQRAPLVCWAAVGTEDRVVPPASAAALSSFSNVEHLPKGHISLVKANDRNDPTYQLIARFIGAADAAVVRRDGEWALKHLTYRLRKVSLAGRWVSELDDEIILGNEDDNHRLQCHVRTRRRGGMAQREFVVAAWMSGYRPRASIDFDWEVGRGVLSEAQYDEFVSNARLDLDDFFQVDVEVSQGGRRGAYTLANREDGIGFFLFHLQAPDWLEPGLPCEELELNMRSFTDRRQGWMYYSVPMTVARRLQVCFQAPFDYRVLARLGKGTDVQGPTRSGGSCISRVCADRPVAMGRNILWIYGH